MDSCHKCGTSFVRTPHQIKKRDFQCRQCRRSYDVEWRKKRGVLGLPARGKTDKEKQRAYKKQYHQRPDVKQRFAVMMRDYRRDPALRPKHEARWKVHRALASGKLERQPCEICGDTGQAHHDDYSRPLDVRWLCHQHHRELHKLAEGER